MAVSKNKGRAGWWSFGLVFGLVLGSFIPSCGTFIVSQPARVKAAYNGYTQ